MEVIITEFLGVNNNYGVSWLPHFFYPSLPFPSTSAQLVFKCLIESGVTFTSGSKNNPKILLISLNMRWNVFEPFL